MGEGLSELFEHPEFTRTDLAVDTSPEDLFSILETFEDAITKEVPLFDPFQGSNFSPRVGEQPNTGLVSQGWSAGPSETDDALEEAGQALKKRKLSDSPVSPTEAGIHDGQQKTSHIAVERNRRKQMNEHLSVLRSLMPCFYAKRGDQASIIGGVVDYIKELQQVLQSLEAKKQRKVYSEVLSPRPLSSPRPSPLSPRPPPLSPRMTLPISPRTPQPGSPYMPKMQQNYVSPTLASSHESSSPFFSSISELAANSKSPVADVEVKFSGPNVILKTASHRIPGQVLKIIAALEGLALEILHVSISTTDDTMLNSFTIKIGIECVLSAEELAQAIQQTFS
ncbi:transcription factor SPEECHLESS-like [Musa acuminata AAA Group]|uniref:transcription factor SPEECHLESS-like n=1 Tax=Musa acuminata AAA Group TaxID=214697 RepID=UPI0008A0F577|nr:PREDICTED: transcription factor SPEECHLESS-like [Musa acuminata subsp. malaccensis]